VVVVGHRNRHLPRRPGIHPVLEALNMAFLLPLLWNKYTLAVALALAVAFGGNREVKLHHTQGALEQAQAQVLALQQRVAAQAQALSIVEQDQANLRAKISDQNASITRLRDAAALATARADAAAEVALRASDKAVAAATQVAGTGAGVMNAWFAKEFGQ
jgi:hypothetical protein